MDTTWLRGFTSLIGVVRQQVEVQPVLRELSLVEGPPARADRDVARGQLRRRQRLRIERQREADPVRQVGKPNCPGVAV